MPLQYVFYAVLGLVVGSFLNVCIHRIPRGESIVLPGSRCPQCGKAIRPYHNIPLLGFLLLRGRCHDCRAPISGRYPVVEFITGVAFLACAVVWRFQPPTFVNSALICAILVLGFIDYDHQILPNAITIPGIVAGIGLSPFQDKALFADPFSEYFGQVLGNSSWAASVGGSILGAIIGGGVLYLVSAAYKITRGRQGLGLGDVKMMAMVGAFLGWRLALLTIFAGSLAGSLIGIFLVLFRGKNLQTKLAFGTFLGAGAVWALFFGSSFIQWYTGAR